MLRGGSTTESLSSLVAATRERSKRNSKSDISREGNTHRAAVMLAGFQLASCNS